MDNCYSLCSGTLGDVCFHGVPAWLFWSVGAVRFPAAEARRFVFESSVFAARRSGRRRGDSSPGLTHTLVIRSDEVIGAFLREAAQSDGQLGNGVCDILDFTRRFVKTRLHEAASSEDGRARFPDPDRLPAGAVRLLVSFCEIELLRYFERFDESLWITALASPELGALTCCPAPWAPSEPARYKEFFVSDPMIKPFEEAVLPF